MEHAGYCPVSMYEKHVWAALWHSGLNFKNVSDLFRKLGNSLMDLAGSLHLVLKGANRTALRDSWAASAWCRKTDGAVCGVCSVP